MTRYIDFDLEKGFPIQSMFLKDVAEMIGGKLIGENNPVEFLSRLNSKHSDSEHILTYVNSLEFWENFCGGDINSAIVDEKSIENIPKDKNLIIIDYNPEQAYFDLHELIVKEGLYSMLKPLKSSYCNIHPSAVIYDNVVIGSDVVIEANVVIYPNTFIDEGAIIGAGSVIGGQGGEYKMRNGIRRRTTHMGGTYIGKNVEIGSHNTIDRAVMGVFTIISEGTKTENLIHIAHNSYIGKDCTISSSAEISGSVRLGNGVWYGPNCCCKHGITIGDSAYITLGSILINDVPDYAFMIGNPPRQSAWMCKCHKHKLFFSDGKASCICGREYHLINEQVQLIKE